MKINDNKGLDDIIDYFSPVDLDAHHNKKAALEIEKLQNEIKILKKELKIAKTELSRFKKNPTSSNHTLEDTKKRLEVKYGGLSQKAFKSLVTAEYLFSNEKLNIDYTPIFIEYTKVIELEFRGKLKLSSRKSLGEIIKKMELIPELRGFAKVIKEAQIVNIRNRGIHQNTITKYDCGKIRKILLGEEWLDRILFVFESENLFLKEEVTIDGYLTEEDERLKVGRKFYNLYSCDSGDLILSQNDIPSGKIKLKGTKEKIDGTEYIVL